MWTQKHSDYSSNGKLNGDHQLWSLSTWHKEERSKPHAPLSLAQMSSSLSPLLPLLLFSEAAPSSCPLQHILSQNSLSPSNQWIILLYKCRERLKSWANMCCLTWAGHVREQDLRPVGKWQSLPKLAQTWVFTVASSVCSNAGNCSFLLLTASDCCLGTSYQD